MLIQIARDSEANEEVEATRKEGQDFLVYYFGSKN